MKTVERLICGGSLVRLQGTVLHMRAGKPALQGAHEGERNVLKPFSSDPLPAGSKEEAAGNLPVEPTSKAAGALGKGETGIA